MVETQLKRVHSVKPIETLSDNELIENRLDESPSVKRTYKSKNERLFAKNNSLSFTYEKFNIKANYINSAKNGLNLEQLTHKKGLKGKVKLGKLAHKTIEQYQAELDIGKKQTHYLDAIQ